MTADQRDAAFLHHKTMAQKAKKRGDAIAAAPAEPNSHLEMTKAYSELQRHTLKATAIKQEDSFIGPVFKLLRYLNNLNKDVSFK